MAGIEVTLNDWMFRAIVKDRRVLTTNPRYFGLTMGLERRLYELARKHLGQQPIWQIGLPRLAEKCGSRRGLRQQKAADVEIMGGGRPPAHPQTPPPPPAPAPARPPKETAPGVFQ